MATVLRKCTVITTKQDGNTTFMSAAANGSDLINEFVSQNVEFNSGMKIMLRNTNGAGATTIEDNSTLPESDFIVFVTPRKVKSGK